jgi:ABC-type multidrug transport system fused ATPase/permease subunit
VLEKGRIVEVGRHDDLLATPGSVYSKLYSLQAIETPRPGHVRPHPTIQ